VGAWVKVTPKGANLVDPQPCDGVNFGTGSAYVNAAHPETVYTQFECQGIWKSTDYGQTWKGPINTGSNGRQVSSCAGGITGPANSQSGVLYQACIRGEGGGFWKSTNGGVDWTQYDVVPGYQYANTGHRQDFYPPEIDPYDEQHLVMAGHEMNWYVESFDGGRTWHTLNIDAGMMINGGTGAMVFINTGTAATTRTTWLFVPQFGSNVGTWRTTDAGKNWTKVDNNEKGHSFYQIYQPNTNGSLFMAGVYSALGWGVLHSTNYGAKDSWEHVDGPAGGENIVFGTSKNLYAMSGASPEVNLQIAAQPGTGKWIPTTTPAEMTPAPAVAAVTNDGAHNIIILACYSGGLWRYVEP
jgi:hypothetical protein